MEELDDSFIDELLEDKPVASVATASPEPKGGTDATEYQLTWCEFCKGHYIEEFHFGQKD